MQRVKIEFDTDVILEGPINSIVDFIYKSGESINSHKPESKLFDIKFEDKDLTKRFHALVEERHSSFTKKSVKPCGFNLNESKKT